MLASDDPRVARVPGRPLLAHPAVDAFAQQVGVTGTYEDGVVSLREVLVHMIEEYARHAGHADLLRERIDGRVGQ